MKISIKALRDVKNMPCFYALDDSPQSVKISAIKCSCGKVIPVQSDIVNCKKGFTAILNLEKGKTYEYELIFDGAFENNVVLSNDQDRKTVNVSILGEKFTEYSYTDKINKPFIGMVCATKKDGTKVDLLRLDLNTEEHPHQRALFVGVGDVNGVDFWNEEGNWGKQIHSEFEELKSGPVFGKISAKNTWKSIDGTPYVDEIRSYKFYNQTEDFRCVDVELKFTAAYGDVTFGRTKEAGPLGIRLSEIMNGKHGGVIRNSYGACGENECWGKSAHWCDYYNNIDGETFGVSVFDNPSNILYPTAFHVREYGLFAANNLYFKSDVKILNGESLTYKFRVVFHKGDTDSAGIENAYLNYLGYGADISVQ